MAKPGAGAASAHFDVEGEESPWFPGCKVYRQKVDGAWEEALAALARDLEEAFRD